MAIHLHSNFGITERARAAFEKLADEYRAIGDVPRVACIMYGTTHPQAQGQGSVLVMGYYCEPEVKNLPIEEIGEVDGVACVFALAEHIKPYFEGKILDWTPTERWVLKDRPRDRSQISVTRSLPSRPSPTLRMSVSDAPANENDRQVGGG